MANKYTGKEINLIDLTTAKELVDAYQKIKVKVGDLSPINYAFFSVTALEELVTFLKSNQEAKGVKFNLAVVPIADQPSLSLVTWAVDENGNPIASAERALGDGSATQSSEMPCPQYCYPPE